MICCARGDREDGSHRAQKVDAAAAGGGGVLHGLGRALRPGRPGAERGLRTGAGGAGDHTAAVGAAHGADGGRTGQRHPGRGRLLRVGAAGDGPVLGIPGSVAVAGGQRLRHGALSHAVRALPGTDLAAHGRRASRRWRWASGWWRCACCGTWPGRRRWERDRWWWERCCWRRSRCCRWRRWRSRAWRRRRWRVRICRW